MKSLKTYKDVNNLRSNTEDKLLIKVMLSNLLLFIIYIFNSQYANIFNLFNKNIHFFSTTTFVTIFMNLIMVYFLLSVNRTLLYYPVNNESEKLRSVFSSNPIELLIVEMIQILIKFSLIFISLFIVLGNILKNGINSGIITPYNFFNFELLQAGFLEMNSDILVNLFSWKDLVLIIVLFVAIELLDVKLSAAKYIVMMDNAAVGVINPFIDSFTYISGDKYKVLLKIRFKYILLALLPIPFLIVPLIFSSRSLLVIYLFFILFYELYVKSIYMMEEAFFIGHGPLSIRLYEHLLYKSRVAKKDIELMNNVKTCRFS